MESGASFALGDHGSGLCRVSRDSKAAKMQMQVVGSPFVVSPTRPEPILCRCGHSLTRSFANCSAIFREVVASPPKWDE